MSNKITYSISIIFAIIVATSMLVSSYFSVIEDEEFINFSVLGPDKKAQGYPSLMVIGKNNTCVFWVTVENHKKENITCKVMLKISDAPISGFPVPVDAYKVYFAELDPEEAWVQQVDVKIEKTCSLFIIFELWIYDKILGDFTFSDNFLVIPVDVVAG